MIRNGVFSRRHQPVVLMPPLNPALSPANPGSPRLPHSGPDPFAEMARLQQQVDRMFEQAFQAPPPAPAAAPSPATGAVERIAPADAFQAMRRLHQQVDGLFHQTVEDALHEGFQGGLDEGWTALAITPAIDVHDEGGAYVVTVDLPGAQKDSLHVTVSGEILTIMATQSNAVLRRAPDGSAAATQRRTERFERRLRLPMAPDNAQDIRATYDHDVLSVRVPKPKAGARAVEIPIQ